MSPFAKATITGLLTGILGLILSVLPVGYDLEETHGLDLLFKLRGKRDAPSDVMIVAMDDFSSENLNLPLNHVKWPRFLHARLIEYLTKEGAAVIAFDVNFGDPFSMEDDALFAEAIQKAQNVILYENLKKEAISLTDDKGAHTGNLNIEKLVQPYDLFARYAVALAPFPLPKVPVRVSQYWTFKTSAGDMPTLPVVVFQIFALDVYDEFIQLLTKVNPIQALKFPRNKKEIITDKKVKKFILSLRYIFMENPSIAKQILEELTCSDALSSSFKKDRILKSLVKMYQSPDSCYLNFYGPPGTISTVSYFRVLHQQKQSIINQNKIDFNNKVVFVGLSERLLPKYKDGFHTSYSQSSGVDISGVEMAATAFANLLEGMPVRPLPFVSHGLFVFVWGFLLGIVCRFFSPVFSLPGVIALGMVYLAYAQYQFKSNGDWYPLIIPLFFQSSVAFFGSVLWKYTDTNRERQTIRNALGYYLPNNVVDQLVKSIATRKTHSQIMYGTCLCTDAGQYTRFSETMTPKELSRVMHEYYKALFEPVKKNRGIVINIVGDSMMALWAKAEPDSSLRNQACLAALEISNTVNRFNRSIENLSLPTRVGLHHGQLSLGNVGAMDHYEYRPTGDIVNTSSRMEGLNKYLGTQILVSGEVMDQLNGFLTRDLGQFLLSGKSNPISVYELIGTMDQANDRQRDLCSIFSQALNAYKEKSWGKAINFLYQTIRVNGMDGPSLFYLKRIEKYKKNPPGERWNGVVHMDKK